MNRYEKDGAAHRIDGYYTPAPHEEALGSQVAAFERAKAETLKHLRASLEQTEALTSADFFAITKRRIA